MNQNRLRKLTKQMLAHGVDGIAVVPGPNMVYLSGIHSHLRERPIVLFFPADDDPAIIIPNLEAMKAREAGIPEAHIFSWTDEEGYTGAFQQACAYLELADYLMGVEALHMRVLELELLRSPLRFLGAGDLFYEKLEFRLDVSEVERLIGARSVSVILQSGDGRVEKLIEAPEQERIRNFVDSIQSPGSATIDR